MRLSILFLSLIFMTCFTPISNAQRYYQGWIEEVKVEPFSELEVDGLFNIYLTQGDSQRVEIAGHEADLHNVQIYTRGKRLIIDRGRRFRMNWLKKVDVFIQVTDLQSIELDGVGNITCEEKLILDRLNVEVSGLGNTFLDIEANELDIEMSGVGNIILQGETEVVNIENSSLGKIDAADLRAQVMHLDNESWGGVRIFVEKELYLDSSGLGNVYLRGDAQVKRLEVSGFGKIRHL